MITLRIDLSSAKDDTAACAIEWKKKRAVARTPQLRCDDENLDKLIAFVDAVAGGNGTIWSPDERKRRLGVIRRVMINE